MHRYVPTSIFTGLFILIVTLLCVVPAPATPLRLEYWVTDVGGGTFQYDFVLSLDNNDLSWKAGQGFNWIVFGDADMTSPLTDWLGNEADLPIGPFIVYGSSTGGHNGPTLIHVDTTGAADEGWVPAEVGDSLHWSGTSSANVPQGDLLFSNLAPVNLPDNRANFAVAQRVEAIGIAILPGDATNSINTKSRGKIPVAILSTQDFYAPSQVDPTSLTFGRTGYEQSRAFCPSSVDVNRDGLQDLICQFNTQDTGFRCGDAKGILRGKTTAGAAIAGSDSVTIVPCK